MAAAGAYNHKVLIQQLPYAPDHPLLADRYRTVVTGEAAALVAVLGATVRQVSRVMTRDIRASALGTLAVALVVTFVVAACGSDGGGSSASPGSQIERGAEVYAGSCASCHGADLRGTDKGPSHLSIVYEPGHHTDDSFRSAIANGAPQHHWRFGDMEPVEGLIEEEVEAVIAFVRAEQQRQGFER